jgi:hypothetical protein
MRHPATKALYAYWNEVRGERLAPRRLEIQPARIAELLLDTFILERADKGAFRFRLAGTRVAARFEAPLKANDFLSCWGEGDRALLAHHLAAISDLGRVGLFTGEADRLQGLHDRAPSGPVPFELLVLPLLHTGDAIDRLLCLLVPIEEGGGAPAREPAFRRLRLLAAEAVWPNGAPDDPLAFSDRQTPLRPNVRMARIVRQGRRQFRVYQGGLETAAAEDKGKGNGL